jgi:hypothetical protein
MYPSLSSLFGLSWKILLPGLGLALLSCQSRELSIDLSQRYGYDYFPLEKGRYSIYEGIDSVFSLSIPKLEVKHYQLMEVMADASLDLAGDTVYRLERFSRPDAASPWTLDSIWTARLLRTPDAKAINRAVRTENNIAIIKLVFPLEENKSWNPLLLSGNDLSQEPSVYTMKAVTKAFRDYPQSMTVVQNQDTSANQVNQRKYLEVYAPQAGLVYKEQVNVEFCTTQASCIGRKIITFGSKKYLTLKEWGKK